ncbi:hypothetical protein ILUMI_26649 [Ignelater luminosus]|uniref:Uncharacterized protein n=1 Tax=Ignelater luminosus TaxID=2038154 RepID=A0A8K0C819_IGNLU|nr:hypothetical protein ILUMI_26649 [Ignelater luminosus]
MKTKKNNSDPNQVLYFLPSHWFTEYSESAAKEKIKEKDANLNQNKISKNNESTSNKKADDNYKTKFKTAQKVINILKRKPESTTEAPTDFRRNPSEEFSRNRQPTVETLQPNALSATKDAEVHNLNTRNNNAANNVNNNFITSTTTRPSKPNQNLQNDEYHWKSLRNFYLIPDYEFPLDPVARPGYDGRTSSFDVEPRSNL